MRDTLRTAAAIVLAILVAWILPASAQDKPYKEGTVWAITFIKVKPGMFDTYLRDLAPQRKKINDEAMKEGLLLSSHIFTGTSANHEDWDLMLMDEYKNWAAFDGLDDKYEAIAAKMIGSEDKRVQIMVKRNDMREIVGDKVVQELILK
jgi:hypothetical protein